MDAAGAASVCSGTKKSPSPDQDRPKEPRERRPARWAPLGALFVCLALRLPGLTTLPIFVDESFYIHEAQLVARDPIGNAFVSLIDPKPPLHIWLVALFLGIGPDPLWSGRFVSVLAGAATVLLLFPLCRMLKRLEPAGDEATDGDGIGFASISALLAAACPYLVFYDRLATPDALVVTESVLVGWLSLRLARAVWGDPAGSGSGLAASGAVLGIALGLAMFTRQYFTYVLWLLPVLAFALWPTGRARFSRRVAFRRLLGSQLIAAGVALVIWSPYLLVKSVTDVWTRIFYWERYAQKGMDAGERLSLGVRNAVEILSPVQADSGGHWQLGIDTGWFWTYLTPPISLLAVVGFVRLARRSSWRLGVFLAGWFLLTCLPLLLFATVLFPRYGLPAVVPLLLAAAWLLSDVLRRLSKRSLQPQLRAAAVAVGLAAVLAWPVVAVARQLKDVRPAALVPADRAQYVSGWTAGAAVQEAIAFIDRLSRTQPVIVVNVVTDAFPNLAATVFFERNPRVRVYHADLPALAASVESWRQSRRLFVRTDFRYTQPVEPVSVPEASIVLVLRPEPLTVERSVIPEPAIAAWGHLILVARFANSSVAGYAGDPGAIRIERFAR